MGGRGLSTGLADIGVRIGLDAIGLDAAGGNLLEARLSLGAASATGSLDGVACVEAANGTAAIDGMGGRAGLVSHRTVPARGFLSVRQVENR